MFKHEYQEGTHVELFSSQGRNPTEKWRVVGSRNSIRREYDKEVKSYVYVLDGGGATTKSKLSLPKDEKQTLKLVQPFLAFQLMVPHGLNFAIDLSVSDAGNSRRKIYLSSVHREMSANPLHARVPLVLEQPGQWTNLVLDLIDLVHGLFKGQVFRSVEAITVCENCRLRRVFTLKSRPLDTSSVQLDEDLSGVPDSLPSLFHLATNQGQPAITQVMTLKRLRAANATSRAASASSVSSASSQDGSSTRRQQNDQATHIAFGRRIRVPKHILKAKESDSDASARSSRTPSSASGHDSTAVTSKSSDAPSNVEPILTIRGSSSSRQAQSAGSTSEIPSSNQDTLLQEDESIENQRASERSSSSREGLELKLALRPRHSPATKKPPSIKRHQHQVLGGKEVSAAENGQDSTAEKRNNQGPSVEQRTNKDSSQTSTNHGTASTPPGSRAVYTFASKPRRVVSPRRPYSSATSSQNTSPGQVSQTSPGDPFSTQASGFDGSRVMSSSAQRHLESDFEALSCDEHDGSPARSIPFARLWPVQPPAGDDFSLPHGQNGDTAQKTITEEGRTNSPGKSADDEHVFPSEGRANSVPGEAMIQQQLSDSDDLSWMKDSHEFLGETLDEHERLAAVGRAPDRGGLIPQGRNISAEEMVLLAEQSQESTLSSDEVPNQAHHLHLSDTISSLALRSSLNSSLDGTLDPARELGGAFSPAVVFPSQRLSESHQYQDFFDQKSPSVSSRGTNLSQSLRGIHEMQPMDEEEEEEEDRQGEDCSGPEGAGEEEIDLLYDQSLNCFFDPSTGKYYELNQ